MNTPFYLEELRKHVLKKAGVIHVDPGDCRYISDVIYSETKKYVSETTIKRFFGYANTQFNFSGFTLNSLAQFIGFESFKTFCEGQKITEKTDASDIWNSLKQKSAIITEYSLRAIRSHSGIPFEITAKRKFAYIDYQYFLNSKAQISCIVAPAGYGKSITVAQTIMELNNQPPSGKDNILLFINMSIIPNVNALGFDLSDWILEELGLSEKTSYRSYFENHPEACKGHIIVVADGFDTGELKSKYSILMMNFLYALEKLTWVKVLLSMRTNTWLELRQQIYDSAFLTKALYKDNFFDTEYHCNLPLLSNAEVIYTLNHIDNKAYKIEQVNKDLMMQLKTPFWFHYYYEFKKTNFTLSAANPLIGYELIMSFVKSKIFEDNQSTETLLLLQHISTEITNIDGVYAVKKDKLLGLINAYPNIYFKLLQKGVLIEQKKIVNNTPEEVISMLHDVYPYFLYRHLLEMNSQRINEALFTYIYERYSNNIPVRLKLLKWAIRGAIMSNDTAHLSNIIRLPFTNEEKINAFNFVCEVTNYVLEQPGEHPLAKEMNIGFFHLLLKGAISTKIYRKTVGLLAESVTDQDIRLMLLTLIGGFNVLEMNKAGLKRILMELNKHRSRLNELCPICPFEILLYHYQRIYQGTTDINIDAYINAQILKIDDEPRTVTSLSIHELVCIRLAITILTTHKDYKNAMMLMYKVNKLYPKLWFRRTALFTTLSKALIGINCILNGDLKMAKRLHEHLEKLIVHSKQTYYTNYILIRYHQFRALYAKASNRMNLAIEEFDKALEFSKSEQLDLLTLLLTEMKIDALRAMGSEEGLEKTYNEFSRLLKQHDLGMEEYRRLGV